MPWEKPFGSLGEALQEMTRTILDAQLKDLARLQRQMENLLKNTKHATTLKMPVRGKDDA